MCGDLNDPENPTRPQMATTLAPIYGVNASMIQSDPNAPTPVSEVVVKASPREVIHLDPAYKPISLILQQIQPLNISFVAPSDVETVFRQSIPTLPVPCITRSPTSVSLQDLMDHTIITAIEIGFKTRDNGGNKEVTGAIYLTQQGEILTTTAQTDPNNTQDNFYFHFPFPVGSKILAFIHSHPSTNGVTIPTPSEDDQRSLNGLASGLHGDKDMVAVIVEMKPGNQDFNIRVYDRSHFGTSTPGCLLRGTQ